MAFPSKAFNLELPDMGDGSSAVSFVLVGASKSGKSTLLKYLLKKYFNKHLTILFTMNEQAEIYNDIDNKIIVSDKYHPELLEEGHIINKEMKNKHKMLFVSDDYVGLDIKNDKEITRLLTIYRNSNQSSIFSFQGRTLLSSIGRNNANYIIVLKQQTNHEWINVIKDFLEGHLPIEMTLKEKVAFCMAACKNHQFFVIDNMKEECYISKLSPSQIAE